MNLEKFPDNETAKRMLGTVTTGFYDNSYVGKWLFQVLGIEVETAREAVEELALQVFPETAAWGLFYHEQKYGLPVREDLSYEERRKRILAKRDTRIPMTPWQMEQIISSLTGCKCHIDDDRTEPNTFQITLYGDGRRLDFTEVEKRLNQIKQSHVKLVNLEEEANNSYPMDIGLAQVYIKEASISFSGGREDGI